ncbi:hypothetical protein AUF78_15215 [archaeon 13_1_20CM_2_51_12]|nr:MAG: hypothetical protein AUF78_15215 [archaeon 13_1_20CM_2_51_12]
MRLFDQTSILKLRLLLLCTVILLTSPLTYQLLMGTSDLSMASFANIQSTPTTIKTLTVPANNFSVMSGSISGLADNSIYANVDRVRAAMTSPDPGVVSASYYFKILGSSPTVVPDSDGVTRQGVVFWANMHNACNLYFLFWRTDSTKPAGTTVVGAKVQVNPTITSLDVNHSDLIACAGVGYSTISQPDGTPAEISSNTNVMDGNWHNFTVVKLGPERWRLYTDSMLAFEAYDPANNFPIDSNLWGLRLDNVQIQLYYELTIDTTQLFSTSFTVAPPTGPAGQSISFSASVSGGILPYTYSWNFGDGVGTSSVQSPTYSYGSPGSYMVILLTTDSVGATATAFNGVTITAGNSGLTATISVNTDTPQSGQTVLFTASSNGGMAPYGYTWNLGDDSTATGTSVGHLYAKAGNYTVVLTTTDYLGETTTSSKTVSIATASTTQSQPPSQPPSNQPSGGICILCSTSRLVSMLSLFTIGLIAGGFLSVGIFLSRYHAQNRRLATELQWYNRMNRTTPSLRVKRTKTTRKTRNQEYRTLQQRVWANQHRGG